MSATCQDIIDQGFAKSSASRPDTMTAPAELVSRVGQCLQEVFQVISRENPSLLGVTAQMSFAGSLGWQRPANCLRAIKVVADATTVASPALAVGEEVNIVPYDDQLFCEGSASITELGQAFFSCGQAMDPSGGTLTLVYARTPTVPTLVSDTIDALFPPMFNAFLAFDMALYLAIKDDRDADVQKFASFKGAILEQIVEWTEQPTYNLQQRHPAVSPPMTNVDGGRQPSGRG